MKNKALVLGALLFSTVAQADLSGKTGFSFAAGGFYPRVDSSMKVDVTGPNNSGGTLIDFEDDLGLQESKVSPMLELKYAFNDKHEVALSYFQLYRNSSKLLTGEITVGEEVFDTGLLVNTNMDLDILQARYGYTIWQKPEKYRVGVLAGLHMINFDVGLQGGVGASNTDEVATIDTTASLSNALPLPNIGLFADYQIVEDFYLQFHGQYFAIDIDVDGTKLDGGLTNLQLGLEYFPLDALSLYIGANMYIVDGTFTRPNQNIEGQSNWNLKFNYWGPLILARYYF